jgi:hypothetical protein
MANISIRDLSITISKLIELDDLQNEIELALNRAVSAKEVSGGMTIRELIILCGGYITGNPREKSSY